MNLETFLVAPMGSVGNALEGVQNDFEGGADSPGGLGEVIVVVVVVVDLNCNGDVIAFVQGADGLFAAVVDVVVVAVVAVVVVVVCCLGDRGGAFLVYLEIDEEEEEEDEGEEEEEEEGIIQGGEEKVRLDTNDDGGEIGDGREEDR